MVTVRDAVRLMPHAEHIYITFAGSMRELCTPSKLEMDAFGDYVVSEIFSVAGRGENEFELVIEPSGFKTHRRRKVRPRKRHPSGT